MLAHGPVTALAGFDEGAWWVQDAAASLPVRLLGDIRGRRVADLCAAPGGKTAQLVAAGAHVTAIDRAPVRLKRLQENLARLSLKAELVCADVTEWTGGTVRCGAFDAPCSATGTIRRHPDVPWLKREEDVTSLAGAQRRLIEHAAALTKPGGTLVYCTCSLEPRGKRSRCRRRSWRTTRICGASRSPPPNCSAEAELISANGDLRSLPCQLPDPDLRFAGLDGFYAARLVKQ